MSRILIVEDDPLSRELLVRLLVSRSHHTLEAENGREALEIARQQRPDLVLADILMPVMDGFELLCQLRLDPATASIPVILVTGAYHDAEAWDLAAAGGAVALVQKPYESKELFDPINAALASDRRPVENATALAEFGREHTRVLMDKLWDKASEAEQAGERLRKSESQLTEAQALAQMDITERELAEEALRHSEERFRTIFDQAIIGIVQTDLTGRLLDANDCYCATLGYSREELRQLRMQDITHPDDLPENAAQFQALVSGGPDYQIEKRYRRKDGSVIWVINRVNGIRNAAGGVQFVVAISLDVTARKRSEHALRESEERMRAVLDSALDCVITMDHQGRVVEFNPAAEKTFGYPRDGAIGQLLADLIIPPALRERHRRGLAHYLSTGEASLLGNRVELTGMRSDHSEFPVELGITRIGSQEPPMFTGFIRDITERKKAERQIEHFAELFQALSHSLMNIQEEERRHLARELHDEIGQTLTAAKFNLKIIAPDVPPAVAGRIEDSIQLLDRLLTQVRQLSLDLRPPLLDELGLVPALRWLADQQAQRAGLRVTFTPNVEGLDLDAALRTACFRVAQEAITNAIRHARAATVAVELRAEPDRVWLVVHDDGVGFDKDAMQQRAVRGASAGLLSMKERVSLLGGELEIGSAPGRGTEIRAWFPFAPPGPNDIP